LLNELHKYRRREKRDTSLFGVAQEKVAVAIMGKCSSDWCLKIAIASDNRQKALHFEEHLETLLDDAFAKKTLKYQSPSTLVKKRMRVTY